MANVKGPISGTFTGTGSSDSMALLGRANISLIFNGADATIALERSFDKGATWLCLSKNSVPEPAQFTSDIDTVIEEHEKNVIYRWNCIGYTSGSIFYRLGTPEKGM